MAQEKQENNDNFDFHMDSKDNRNKISNNADLLFNVVCFIKMLQTLDMMHVYYVILLNHLKLYHIPQHIHYLSIHHIQQ